MDPARPIDAAGRGGESGATISLTPPALVVLVGAAGSGKSTFAARHFPPTDVLSSDAFRAIVGGAETNQDATRPAFSIIHREVIRRLASGRLVVVDATSAERHARRSLVARAATAGAPAVAIVFALPDELVLARNAARAGRVVDPGIVARHLALIAPLSAETLLTEGFSTVHVLRTPADVERVAVVIRPAAAPGR